ncbi:YihY/virulence factor BrkB family protein [Streptomyces sp. NPDC051940]|uniref:YihY/virulence factor BrkB family protein n=1 Tax=Streptomyces sp. NPDC051940 TaxID=3155675 RepID=UPI0034303973
MDTASGDLRTPPARLPAKAWRAAAVRTAREGFDDRLGDRAAMLTYYGVLSMFPTVLVFLGTLGAVGERAIDSLLESLGSLAPGPARDLLASSLRELEASRGSGLVVLFGLLGALWAASGYVGAFIRAANAVYDLPEGRPLWKVTPLRLGLTFVLLLLMAAGAFIVVFTGPVAERVGDAVGLGDAVLTLWAWAKWPVLLLIVLLVIALLYWAAPNARVRGFRWLTPGAFVAVAVWLAGSAGFTLYVANFGSYNRTYGTMAGAAVFLLWLWLTNLAVLLGLEFDAELARQRGQAAGWPPDAEPYVDPRDTRTWPPRWKRKAAARRDRLSAPTAKASTPPTGKPGT